ncbi:MAG: hypothetical protein FIA95_01190 [Gemmatimonadetes bacterium]|nr:hypothetical protein [Gemmatimonadota bacterium]
MLRDSAGVVIVESRVPQVADSRWAVILPPALTLGVGSEKEVGDTVLFERVVDVAAFPDGRLIVADEGPQRVYVFTRDGEPLSGWGGRGGGPAEFEGIRAVVPCGGSGVAVLDRADLVLFDASGTLAQRLPVDYATPRITPVGVSPDCSRVLGFRRISDPPAGAVGVSVYQFYWLDPTTRAVDTLAAAGLMESWTRSLYGEARAFPVPWGVTLYTFDATEGGVVVGDPRVPQLSFLSSGGRVSRIIRWDRPGASVESRDTRRYEAARRQWREGKPPDPEIDFLFPELSEYPKLPRSKPVFDRVLVDASGRVWVRAFPEESLGILDQRLGPAVGATGLVWSVFDTAGVWAGDLHLPPGFDLLAASGDLLYGVSTDSLGVQSVRVFGLAPG